MIHFAYEFGLFNLKIQIDVVERQVVSAVEERDACLGEIARLQVKLIYTI